jgi:uncharacterized protein (DUF4415 family)
MISDEPDEDADALDDDAAIDSLLSDAETQPGNTSHLPSLPEWPARGQRDVGLRVDDETLAWFKATHPDWQRQMGFVLRAWMIASTANQQPEY